MLLECALRAASEASPVRAPALLASGMLRQHSRASRPDRAGVPDRSADGELGSGRGYRERATRAAECGTSLAGGESSECRVGRAASARSGGENVVLEVLTFPGFDV